MEVNSEAGAEKGAEWQMDGGLGSGLMEREGERGIDSDRR